MRSSSATGPVGPVISHRRMVSAPSAPGSPQSLAMSATDSGWPMASPRCSRSFFNSAPVTASPFQIGLCEVRHTRGVAWGVYAAHQLPEDAIMRRLLESLTPDARQLYWKWVGGMFALYVVMILTAA